MPRAAVIAARPAAFPVVTHAKVKTDGLSRLLLAYASRSIEAGRTFLHEGELATDFFTVTEGTVKLFKLLSDGRRAITGFLFPGDVCGIGSEDEYNYSAEAVTPVGLRRFPRRQLDRMYFDSPGLESADSETGFARAYGRAGPDNVAWPHDRA